MSATSLREIMLLGPAGPLQGSSATPLWQARWSSAYEKHGALLTQTFPLRTLQLGPSGPLLPEGERFASGLKRVEHFDVPALIHARLAAGTDSLSQYSLRTSLWRLEAESAKGDFATSPCDVVLQPVPDAGRLWPRSGFQRDDPDAGRIDIPAMRLIAGRIPVVPTVRSNLYRALRTLLSPLGQDMRITGLSLTPDGMDIDVRDLRFMSERCESASVAVRWSSASSTSGPELQIAALGEELLKKLLDDYASETDDESKKRPLCAGLSIRLTRESTAARPTAVLQLQRSGSDMVVLQTTDCLLRGCGVVATVTGNDSRMDIAFDVATARADSFTILTPTSDTEAPSNANGAVFEASSEGLRLRAADGRAALELDYDERMLAAHLRQWQRIDDPHAPLHLYFPVDTGWLQLPYPDLPPIDFRSDRDRLATPKDDSEPPFGGALSVDWPGGRFLLRGARALQLQLPRQAGSSERAPGSLLVYQPDVVLRGLLWLARSCPDAHDALPDNAPQSLIDMEFWPALLGESEVRESPVRFNLTSGLEWPTVSGSAPSYSISVGTSESWRNSELTGHPASQAKAWLRHPYLPLLAQMPMLQHAADSGARPARSRELAPFQRESREPPIELRRPHEAVGPWPVLALEGWVRDALWPWPNAGKSQQQETSVTFAAVGLPGLLISPAPRSLGWTTPEFAQRIDFPLLDQKFSLSSLPPPEESDKQEGASADTLTDASSPVEGAGSGTSTATRQGILARHWGRLRDKLSLSRIEGQFAVDTFGPATRQTNIDLGEPYVWSVNWSFAAERGQLGSIVMNSATGMSVTMAGADGWTTEVAAADLDPQPPDKLKFTGASLGSRLSPDGRWLSDGRGHTYENGLPASRSQSILRKQFKVEQPELTTSLYSLALVRINVAAQVEWLFSCTDVPMLGAEGSVLRHDGTKQPSPMLAWAHDGIATSGYGWRLGAEGLTSKSESLALGPLRFTPLRLAGLDVGGSDSGQPWLQRLQVDGSLQVSEGLGRGEASTQLSRLTFTRLSADAPLALHPIIERISADGKSINASWHWTCSLGLSCRPDDVDRTAQIRLGMAAAESLLTGGTAGLELEFEWLGQPVVLQLQARDAGPGQPVTLDLPAVDLPQSEVEALTFHPESVRFTAGSRVELIAHLSIELPHVQGEQGSGDVLRVETDSRGKPVQATWLGNQIALDQEAGTSNQLVIDETRVGLGLCLSGRIEDGWEALAGWPMRGAAWSAGLVGAAAVQAEHGSRVRHLTDCWMQAHACEDDAADPMRVLHQGEHGTDGPMQHSLSWVGDLALRSQIQWPGALVMTPRAGVAQAGGLDQSKDWTHEATVLLRGQRLELARLGAVGGRPTAIGDEGWCAVFEVRHQFKGAAGEDDNPAHRAFTCIQVVQWRGADRRLSTLRLQVRDSDDSSDPARLDSLPRTFLPRYRHNREEGRKWVAHPGIVESVRALEGTGGDGFAMQAEQRYEGALLIDSTATLWLDGVGLVHLPLLATTRPAAEGVQAWHWGPESPTTLSAFDGIAIRMPGLPTAVMRMESGSQASELVDLLGIGPESSLRWGQAVEQYVQQEPTAPASDTFFWKRAAAQLATVLGDPSGAAPTEGLQQWPISMLVYSDHVANPVATAAWHVRTVQLLAPGQQKALPLEPASSARTMLVTLGIPQGVIVASTANLPNTSGAHGPALVAEALERHATTRSALVRIAGGTDKPPKYRLVPLPPRESSLLRPRTRALRSPLDSLFPQAQRGWPATSEPVGRGPRSDATSTREVAPFSTSEGPAGWRTTLELEGDVTPAIEVDSADATSWVFGQQQPQFVAKALEELLAPPIPWLRSTPVRMRIPGKAQIAAELREKDSGEAGATDRVQPFLPPKLHIDSVASRAGVFWAERWQLVRPVTDNLMDPLHPRFGRSASPGSSHPFQIRSPRPGRLRTDAMLRPWMGARLRNCDLVSGYARLAQGMGPEGAGSYRWGVRLQILGDHTTVKRDGASLRLLAKVSIASAEKSDPELPAQEQQSAAQVVAKAVAAQLASARLQDASLEWSEPKLTEIQAGPTTWQWQLDWSPATPRPTNASEVGRHNWLSWLAVKAPNLRGSASTLIQLGLETGVEGPQDLVPAVNQATLLFTDPEYDRSLDSIAMHRSGWDNSTEAPSPVLYLDRQEYAPGETIAFMHTGAGNGALTLVWHPRRGPERQVFFDERPEQVPPELAPDMAVFVPTSRLRDADGMPCQLAPGDMLELRLARKLANNTDVTSSLRVPIVRSPSLQGPDAFYAVLVSATQSDGQAGISAPLSAQSPLPTGTMFFDLEADLRKGLVRRRAVFEWPISLPASNEAQVFVVKTRRDGQMALPGDGEAGGYQALSNGQEGHQ